MADQIFERIFLNDNSAIVKELVSIPGISRSLFNLDIENIIKGLENELDIFSLRVNYVPDFRELKDSNFEIKHVDFADIVKKVISTYDGGYLVARMSSEEVQNAELYCCSEVGNTTDKIISPSTWGKLTCPSLLIFLKRAAQKTNSMVAYYTAFAPMNAPVVDITVWVYDYREGAEQNECAFSESTDGGLWSGIDYYQGTNPTIHYHYTIENLKMNKKPPVLTPLMDLARNYIYLEWVTRIDWEKFRVSR